LSMDYSRSPAEHYQLGQQLRMLRERGVLVVGSGNIVHNLRVTRREAAPNQAYDWAIEFDRVVGAQIEKGQLAALPDFKSLGSMAAQAHPTHEHYLPLLYAAGAVQAGEAPRFFNADFQSASISMRSVLWS
ncbi:MAG: class III extradiol ring-cleavage dioxygenase, partial [Variovorax sp.]